MIKDLMVNNVSYKTHGIKVGGKWLELAPDIDLNDLIIGKVYTFEIVDTFDNKLKITNIIKGNNGNI